MIDELKVLIPEHTHDAIDKINRAYMLIFTPSDRGQFSTKEFTKINRVPRVDWIWARRIWNPHFPPNIGAFLWKLMLHALPVDTRIQTRGITLASRCRCCKNLWPTCLFIRRSLALYESVWVNVSHSLFVKLNKSGYCYLDATLGYSISIWIMSSECGGKYSVGTIGFAVPGNVWWNPNECTHDMHLGV